MKHVTIVLLMAVFILPQLQADLFPRIDEVNIENNLDINTGGIGNIIAGVDVDGDGLLEIYMVNDNWNDVANEMVPRIYKYEKAADGTWAMVWSAIPPTTLVLDQNTWPTLSLTDLDNDTKMELTWGIVNSTGNIANPARIVVYEHNSGDNFGVDNSGSWDPNSTWTITTADGENIRPVNWEVVDIDNDGIDEIVFASRKSGMRFGICSVSDIPDAGDGTETWTMEFSSESVGVTYTGDNKWDVAILGTNAYFFDEVEISKVSWDGSAYSYTALSPLPGGISFDAVQVSDIDGDGTEEMITGEYLYGDGTRNLWLLEEEADTLKRTALFDINSAGYLNGGRLVGGASGDIDGDGYVDFIFGSRYSGLPNGMIFRFEYQGGAIESPANWEISIIDSAYAVVDLADGGIWNVIKIANMDDDAELEVVYTSSTSVPYSVAYPTTWVSAPVIVLDTPASVSVDNDILIPGIFTLHQNYPNPFNPTTIIPFDLSQDGVVKVVVYNMIGEEVQTLVHEEMIAGHHTIEFNGSNVPSGAYFYNLFIDGENKSKMMMLIK
ncbi:MAG: T9SS type A sorting domain-containing protein [Candidatus Marinimicrobia bacterium]|nr:T9SS type A sorting domain-containing protein [Candidatus Neomarinimicrobiota bacterium]